MSGPTTSSERLAVLHGIAGELAGHVDRARVYQTIVDGVRRLCDARCVVVMSWDGPRRQLVVEKTTGAPELDGQATADLALCASPAFSTRQTIPLDDLEENPRSAKLARRLGLGPALALPLPRRGDGPGLGAVFVAGAKGAAPYSADDVRGLELWALFAGMALTQAEDTSAALRRVARVEQLTASLRAVAEAEDRDVVLERALDCAQHVMGADRAAIYLTDSREELASLAARGLGRVYLEFAAQRYRQSVGAIVPLARVPIHVADAQSDPRTRVLHELAAREGLRSILLVPMLRGPRLLGAVALYHNVVWPYQAEDIADARALADELVMALVHSGRRELGQREATRLRALDRFAHILVEGGGPRRALQGLVSDGVALSARLWNPSMLLLAEAGSIETGGEDMLLVARDALEAGRPATRAVSWGVTAASPIRLGHGLGGQLVGVLSVAELRRVPVELTPPSIRVVVSEETDLAEPQALAAGAAHHLGAMLGARSGREAHIRLSGGKP